jgi:predicted Zn-dependent protease
VNDSSLNASANGLTVKVNSGFLLMFGNDKDIVASVMAHELGHILANHQPKNYAFPRALFQAASPLLSFVPYGGYAGTAINEGANMQVARYSRIQENEADAIGAILAADAGFDPHGLSRFLEMASRCACSGSGFPSGLSIPTSVSSIPTSVAVPLLRTSPLYRSHPNYAARQRIIDLVVQRKAGRITSEQLHSAEPWLAGIYDTLERKRPKQP